MLVAALDGRGIEVRRRWIPWKPRVRRVDPDYFDVSDGADDPLSFLVLVVAGFVAGIVLAVVLTVAILASEFLLVLAVLVPLLALARVFWLLPWIVEARNGNTTLGTVRVRGWSDSDAVITEIAAAYKRGEDPFVVPGTHPGQGYTVA